MFKQLISIVFVVVLWLTPQAAANQIDNLYQADVETTPDNSSWQQQALLQVLVRVSGNAAVMENDAVKAELRNAAGYVKQFETVRQNTGANVRRVLLDAGKVNQLLQSQGMPVWGALRPLTLVWLVEQHANDRLFVRQPEHKFNQAMQQAFAFYGLPLLMPLYDIDDILSLNETDVWAGFWQPIEQASNRYSADVLIAASVVSETQEKDVTYRLTWQMQQDSRTYRAEVSAATEIELMQQFALDLAQQLSQRFASVASAEGEMKLLIDIQQLSGLADIVLVQRALAQVVGVSQVTVKRYQQGTARYEVLTNISAEGLTNALRFNRQLQPVVTDNDQPLTINSSPVLATYRYRSR
ncbi:DUF2066 domain-containing protein [Rheinheimera maricola]|uniref:DUF2066 domain-containing protein n=1 Tax=Rheinheimera maricola TaxID=2793282 RepID=A0ABS7XDE0_9GAMM|nr:DUF2066 domain-containing protein [Rheinheimera maricola]MBZ9613582.1 DUF2066 domain-containing protein [Rheinheimera maricola]